jgi:hypothetical protein
MNERNYEVCGFCGGNGYVYASMYDCDGRQIYDEPPGAVCEYCDGYGQCENGYILLPAYSREHYER